MKIDPINNSKLPIFTRIKQSVSNFGIKLKTLVSDVFQKEEIGGKYVTIDGVRYRNDELPNWTARPYDYIGMYSSRTEFFPEDIEKMKNMTPTERYEYKKYLLKNKLYVKGT